MECSYTVKESYIINFFEYLTVSHPTFTGMLPMPEHQQIQQSKKPDTTFQKQVTPAIQTPASNPASIIQRVRINPKSLTHADVMQLQRTIGNRAVGRLLSGIGNSSTAQQAPVQRQEIPEEEEPLQGKMIDPIQRQEIPEEEEPLQGKMIETIQRQEIPEEEEPLKGRFESKPEQATCPSCSTAPVQREEGNRTGMPDNLKSGVEQLSGMDLSDVRVHYNSDKPITAGALAYAQGNDIYLGPGQDMHLPHEVWHVVQQAHGKVRPTLQLNDLTVNDDVGLETEADVMGGRAVNMQGNMGVTQLFSNKHRVEGGNSEVIQCWPPLWLRRALASYPATIVGGVMGPAAGIGANLLGVASPLSSLIGLGVGLGGGAVTHFGKPLLENCFDRHGQQPGAQEPLLAPLLAQQDEQVALPVQQDEQVALPVQQDEQALSNKMNKHRYLPNKMLRLQ